MRDGRGTESRQTMGKGEQRVQCIGLVDHLCDPVADVLSR